MRSKTAHTPAGAAATDVVLATFRANGLFLAAGDALAANEGLTSARWQVLGAIALAGQRLTVPQIARRMGRTRQSVQLSTNRLVADGLVEAEENPDHRTSPLMRMTDEGGARYEAVQRRQTQWVNELADGISPAGLTTAAQVLTQLAERLATPPHRSERKPKNATT